MRRISRRWTAVSRRRGLGRRRRARRWRSSDGVSCWDRNGVMPVRSSCLPATPPPPRACCATGSGRCVSSASAGTRLRSQPTSREHCMFSDGTAKRRRWRRRLPTWGALTTSRCRCSRASRAPVQEEPPAPSTKRLRSRARRSTSPNARTRRRCGDALLELGRVLRSVGSDGDADDAARRALELYEAKGNRVGAAAAREFLASPEVSLR